MSRLDNSSSAGLGPHLKIENHWRRCLDGRIGSRTWLTAMAFTGTPSARSACDTHSQNPFTLQAAR